MEENTVVYGNIIEKSLGNSRPRTISSDSEDLGLTIDLDEELHKDDQEIGSKRCQKTIINYVDDELCIGCEENETSVNFFVKVETSCKPAKRSASSNEANKRFRFKLESTR